MFTYCNNNPIAHADPSGHALVFCLKDDHDPTLGMFVGLTGGGGGGGAAYALSVTSQITNTIREIEELVNNTNEEVVLEAEHFAFYRGVPVIKLDLPEGRGLSCGIIILDKESVQNDTAGIDTLKHEYGHTLHLTQIGLPSYLCTVVLPSATGAYLSNRGWLPIDYYSLPWERIAEHLGNVQGHTYEPWSNSIASVYWLYSYIIGRTI